MGVSRRDFIKLSTTAAAAGTAVAQAGDAQAAPVLLAQAGQLTPLGFNPAAPAEVALVVPMRPGLREVIQPRDNEGLRTSRRRSRYSVARLMPRWTAALFFSGAPV